MTIPNYGDVLAQNVARRILFSPATQVELTAIVPDYRVEGMLAAVGDQSLWQWSEASTATANTGLVLVPDDNPTTGRWLCLNSGATGAIHVVAWKEPVRVATATSLAANTRTGNVLTATANGALGTVDGVTMVVGDRVLVKDESTGANNGIYTVTSLGGASAKFTFTRAVDVDNSADIETGLTTYVSEGSANGGKAYVLVTANPITLNTTALTFDLFAASTPDATTSVKGIVKLANDLGGTAALPSVVAVNGTTVPATPSAGQSLLASGSTSAVWSHQVGAYHTVRGVVTSNVANLATFTVAGNDGLTYAAGERVLLVGQTTGAENGIYVVGTVATGTAPLTRASDWALGTVLPPSVAVAANEGTTWKNSEWFASVAGSVTVGTTSPALYPRRPKGRTAAMTAGSIAVTNQWIISSAAIVVLTAAVPGGTAGILSHGALTGGAGTGSFTITSSSGSDTATVDYVIFNGV